MKYPGVRRKVLMEADAPIAWETTPKNGGYAIYSAMPVSFTDVTNYGEPGVSAESASTEAIFDGSVARRVFVGLVARRSGKSRDQAEEALKHAEEDSGRPFIDWLKNGGLEMLLKLLLAILAAA